MSISSNSCCNTHAINFNKRPYNIKLLQHTFLYSCNENKDIVPLCLDDGFSVYANILHIHFVKVIHKTEIIQQYQIVFPSC